MNEKGFESSVAFRAKWGKMRTGEIVGYRGRASTTGTNRRDRG